PKARLMMPARAIGPTTACTTKDRLRTRRRRSAPAIRSAARSWLMRPAPSRSVPQRLAGEAEEDVLEVRLDQRDVRDRHPGPVGGVDDAGEGGAPVGHVDDDAAVARLGPGDARQRGAGGRERGEVAGPADLDAVPGAEA